MAQLRNGSSLPVSVAPFPIVLMCCPSVSAGPERLAPARVGIAVIAAAPAACSAAGALPPLLGTLGTGHKYSGANEVDRAELVAGLVLQFNAQNLDGAGWIGCAEIGAEAVVTGA